MEEFKFMPDKPVSVQLHNSYRLLLNTHKVCNDFLSFYNFSGLMELDEEDKNEKRLDLLRAALLFASSGLDSFVKQLVRDALYDIIGISIGAETQLKGFIEKQLHKTNGDSIKILSNALVSKNPRFQLISCLMNNLTNKSLQSKDELLKVASFFDIPSRELVDNFNYLRDVFTMRNQLAHEMDFDYSTNKRRVRSKRELMDATNYLFNIANKFLQCLDEKLQKGRDSFV